MIINQVKSVRELKKMTQEELGKSVDVSRQTIIAIEKGSYNPSLELALRISTVLGQSVHDLFQLQGDE